MGDSPADSDLIDMALAGDSDAFGTLCERYRSLVWRTVASVATGPDLEDLAQEAIVRACSSLRRFRREAPFPAWICRIALNVAHDYQRSAWKRRVVQGDPDFADAVADVPAVLEAERRETAREVRAAVARLPGKQRTPIWLHYFEEYSFAEIARLARTSESTIRSRIAAGVKRLDTLLNGPPCSLEGEFMGSRFGSTEDDSRLTDETSPTLTKMSSCS